MTLVPGLAIAVILVWALGGDLGRIATLRFRRTALLYAAFAGQLVAFGPVRLLGADQVEQVQLATYALLLAFCAANRRVPGVWLVALGIAGNALVIAANGGVMPVEPSAVLASGWTIDAYAHAYPNIAVHAGAPLWFLGDIFAIPRFHGSAALSIGDASIVAGAWLVLQRVARRPTTRSRPELRRNHVLWMAFGCLLVGVLVLGGARHAFVVGAAAGLGASFAPVVLAISGRCTATVRSLASCTLLSLGALGIGGTSASIPTSVLAVALAGLFATICATTALSRPGARAPTSLSR
jgi:hypothetical protein